MHMNRERIQKWIIIAATVLGLVISLAGLTYRYIFANETTIKTSSTNMSNTTNLYDKLKLGQPVNILFLGEGNSRNRLFLDQLKKEFESEFSLKPNLTILSTLSGKTTQTQQPDLVLICSGENDEKELSPEQYKTRYEATIQELGKEYPNTELMLVQEPSLTDITVEIHRKLANHYNLSILTLNNTAKGATITESPIDVIKERLNTNPSPAQIENKVPLWDMPQIGVK